MSPNLCFLIVDDDDLSALQLGRLLGARPRVQAVMRVDNGSTALALLRNGNHPSRLVVILDLNMPIMSGLDFLDAIRDDPRLAGLRVVVLSSMDDDHMVRGAYQRGAAAFVRKPGTRKAMEAFVDALCEHWTQVVFQ